MRDTLEWIKDGFHRVNLWLHLRWTIVQPANWAIFWAAVGVAIFFGIGQGREILLRLAEDIPAGGWPAASVWFFLLSLIGTTLAIWYASRSVLYVLYEPSRPTLSWYRRHLGQQAYDAVCRRWREWTPRFLAVFPGLGAAAGLVVGYYELSHVDGRPRTLAVVIVAIELVLFAVLCFRRHLVHKIRNVEDLPGERFTDRAIREYHREAGEPCDSLPPRTRRWVQRATYLSLALVLLFVIPLPMIPQKMGTAFVVLTAIGLFAFLGTCRFSHPVRRRRYGSVLGALLLAIALAAAFGRLGGTDNHAVRELTGKTATEERGRAAERPSLEQHLARWLSLRADLAKVEMPYPVVVAAAQGGGVRAAMWTSVALGSLQDRDPRFACSLFAVAGVSGGALGALAFTAKLDPGLSCGEEQGRPSAARLFTGEGVDCKEDSSPAACQLARAFSEDFLAPTLAGGLFPDLIQRFVPTGWLALLQDHLLPTDGWRVPFLLPDRQQFLETAWERALPELLGPDGGPLGFLEITRPGKKDPTRPALFLIATEVEKGRRWIASDIRLDRDIFVDAVDTLTGRELRDDNPPARCQNSDDPTCNQRFLALPASAAAGLSARFPYVSPPGMLSFKDGDGEERIYHLLDGGIVESSGASTAAEILLAIHGWCARELVEGMLRCTLRSPSKTEPYSMVGRAPCAEEQEEKGNCRTVYIRPAVLQLTNSPWSEREGAEEAAHRPRASGFAEVADPVRGLWNSRTARGRWAHSWLAGTRSLMAGREDLDLDIIFPADDERTDDEKVPLGWLLRRATADGMVQRMNEVLDDSDKMLKWLCHVYGASSDPDDETPSQVLDGDLRHEADVPGLLGTLRWGENGTVALPQPDAARHERQHLKISQSWTFCMSTKKPTAIKPNLSITTDLPAGVTATIRLELNNGDGWESIPQDPSRALRGEQKLPMVDLVRVPPKGEAQHEPLPMTTSLNGRLTVWLERSEASAPASITLHSLELVSPPATEDRELR